MALSEQSRHQLFECFSDTDLGVEVTSEMLSHFPARDVEEPVTKAVLHEELALVRMELRTEMSELRHDIRNECRTALRSEIGGLRTEFRTEIGRLRTELRTEMAGIDTKIGNEIGRLATKIDALAESMHRDVRDQMRWLIGTQIAVIPIMVALAAVVVTLVH